MNNWHDDIDVATLQRIKTYSAFCDYKSQNLMLQTLYEAMQKKIDEYKKTNREIAKDFAALRKQVPQWHKVADGDLPKVGVQVLSEQGTLVVYKGDGFNWVEYSPNADSIKLRKWEEPIVWCEIPKYTKE